MDVKKVLEAMESDQPPSAEMRRQINLFLKAEAQAQLDAQASAAAIAKTAKEVQQRTRLRDLMNSPQWAKMSEMERLIVEFQML